MVLILGVETSCDETAAAVVADGQAVHSSVIASQVDIHRRYGGIFPEVASRQHVLSITPVIEQALADAGIGLDALSAVAVTYGPGLAGSLLVGVNAAKGLAFGRGLPLVGINHIEAHIYGNWLISAPPPKFPLVCLVVSGGHTELILMTGHGQYLWLGGTLDDAAGEAFDKVGRLLELPYPGGPSIQEVARNGSPTAFKLPRAWLPGTYNFSFSGLKTAVLRTMQDLQPQTGRQTASSVKGGVSATQPGSSARVPGRAVPRVGDGPTAHSTRRSVPAADLAASFQAAIVEVLVEKTCRAAEEFAAKTVLLAGGVAANALLRSEMSRRSPVPVCCPPLTFCTDNAAMVASAGFFRFQSEERSWWDLDVVPNLRLAAGAPAKR